MLGIIISRATDRLIPKRDYQKINKQEAKELDTLIQNTFHNPLFHHTMNQTPQKLTQQLIYKSRTNFVGRDKKIDKDYY